MISTALIRLLTREHGLLLSAVGLLFILCLGTWGGLVFPQHRQHEQSLLLWNERRRQVNELEQQRSGSISSQNRELLQRLFASVPGYNELPGVLGQVTDTANLHGVTVTSLAYRPVPSTVHDLSCYRLSITCNGDYGAFKAFLTELQRLQPLAYVESIRIEHPDKAVTRLDSSITMQILFRQERVSP